MCANNQTYAAVTGIHTDAARAGTERYRAAIGLAIRATMFGDEDADRLADRARRIAHVESHRGNRVPLIEHLERQLF